MSVLYVPLAVEAYVTNNKNNKEKYIASVAPDYSELNYTTHLGGDLEPKAFESQPPLPEGVHLHFILPDSFTHGVTDEHGNMTYPDVPNRWVVTRLRTGDNIEVKSWMIESDYLGLDNKESITVPFLTDKDNPYRYLGRTYPLGTSVDQGKVYMESLTAVGAGDTTFSTYYPKCKSVFGFYDNLTDVAEGDLTYFVMGYYSDEKKDSLYNLTPQEYAKYITDSKWTVEGGKDQPSKLICQGMVYTVAWKGKEYDYPSNTPLGEINTSIGNTSVESLSAMIAKKILDNKGSRGLEGPENIDESHILERMLGVLQYDLIAYMGEIDGVAEIEDQIHAMEFSPEYGGTTWNLRLTDLGKEKNAYEIMKLVPKGVGLKLTALNNSQDKANTLRNSVNSKRQSLFSAWQRYVNLADNPPPPGVDPVPSESEITAEIKLLIGDIEKHISEIVEVTNDIGTYQKDLEAMITDIKDKIILEEVNKESFHYGKPPALLLGGDGISRQYAFGEDGRFTEDDTMVCRTELVDKLSGSKTSLNRSDIISYCSALELKTDEFEGLLTEAVCLSKDIVAWLCKKVSETKLTPGGTLPSPIAYNEWEQPWISLYLEWKMTWIPTRTSTTPDNSFNNWEFNQVDYEYSKEPLSGSNVYIGRTILTPHSTKLLKHAIEKYIERFKDDDELYKELKTALSDVDKLPVLSQQLSGIWTQLLSLDETLQIPIMVEEEYKELADNVIKAMDGEIPKTVVPDSEFYPVRAGYLKLNEVNIVNTFGIRQTASSYLDDTIYSEELNETKSMGMLPPRFSQGARLNFDWISYSNPKIKSCIDIDSSPVCCYLYPDYLNNALSVYDADGSYKGRMNLVYRDGESELRWVSAPNEPTNLDDVVFISNHTKEFIEGIIVYNTQKDPAFLGLMKLIEKRVDTSCSYTGSQDLFASWSRPLVLTRAKMSLELFGDVEYSQDSDSFGKHQSYGYENIKVPIYLGDLSRALDGSIGFYPDTSSGNQYSNMHCIYNTPKISKDTKYLLYDKPIELSPSDKEGTEFTVLMEASSDISIRTGILPAFKKSIPSEFIDTVLDKLDFTFEIDPIISTLDPVKLPIYSKDNTEWTWFYEGESGYVEGGAVKEPQKVLEKENPLIIDGSLRRREVKK